MDVRLYVGGRQGYVGDGGMGARGGLIGVRGGRGMQGFIWVNVGSQFYRCVGVQKALLGCGYLEQLRG